MTSSPEWFDTEIIDYDNHDGLIPKDHGNLNISEEVYPGGEAKKKLNTKH